MVDDHSVPLDQTTSSFCVFCTRIMSLIVSFEERREFTFPPILRLITDPFSALERRRRNAEKRKKER